MLSYQNGEASGSDGTGSGLPRRKNSLLPVVTVVNRVNYNLLSAHDVTTVGTGGPFD